MVTALPLALDCGHRVRVADHARDFDPARLQVFLRRPQSPPRGLCAPCGSWISQIAGASMVTVIGSWPWRARSCWCGWWSPPSGW
jgi:hypothetical protein